MFPAVFAVENDRGQSFRARRAVFRGLMDLLDEIVRSGCAVPSLIMKTDHVGEVVVAEEHVDVGAVVFAAPGAVEQVGTRELGEIAADAFL